MKIANICFSAPYIEGFSYQENILPRYLFMEKTEPFVIGSTILPDYLKSKKIKSGTYDDDGLKIIRLKSIKITSEFLIPFGLYKQLKIEKPDIIFHHNLNCTSLIICSIYRIFNNNIVLMIDNHADYINRNQNKIWQLFYYKFLIKFSAIFSYPFVKKFYGVTPLRCEYLSDVYGINKKKIDFLPIGADTIAADKIKETKLELKEKFYFSKYPFIFVSGGKMGKEKGTLNLIKAINEINSSSQKAVLILFGSFNDKETQEMARKSRHIIFKGWCSHEMALKLLKIADVAVWPVHHTTLIEDAISVNTPLLIRKTRNTEHLINRNGIFLHSTEYPELISGLKYCLEKYSFNNFNDECNEMKEWLSYKSIAKKVIQDAKKYH